MKIKILSILVLLFFINSCSPPEDENPTTNSNKVLLLKIDYTTNIFKEGKELVFENQADTFTIKTQYQESGDFGGIQLYYDELKIKFFDGTIHWMGLGAISVPQDFQPASQFQTVETADFAFPSAGIENIFNPNNQEYNYQPVWSSIQSLLKVRQYLASNPNASVKLFLYTPSVGVGNPEDWSWIVILKN